MSFNSAHFAAIASELFEGSSKELHDLIIVLNESIVETVKKLPSIDYFIRLNKSLDKIVTEEDLEVLDRLSSFYLDYTTKLIESLDILDINTIVSTTSILIKHCNERNY